MRGVATMSIYEIRVHDMHGNEIALAQYRGKVLLVVNTATECGFTPHYGELERLHRQYQDRGLVVLDFPSNQFKQAPGTVEEIHAFCTGRFGVTFLPFAKVDVAGPDAHPLFEYLTAHTQFAGFDMSHPIGLRLDAKLRAADPNYHLTSEIKWNFTKFLVDRDGKIVGRFEPTFDMAALENIIRGSL
jgi:glutathione peroxidase